RGRAAPEPSFPPQPRLSTHRGCGMHGVPQRAYGPCMNTFWGCDTESMTDLSALYGDHAGTLQTLGRTAGMTARLVDWFGPDDEEHRDATEKTIETLISLRSEERRGGRE